MPRFFDAQNPEFETDFNAFLNERRGTDPDVSETAARILEEVRVRGDAALIDLTARFDGLDLTPETLRIGAAEIEEAKNAVPEDERAALSLAAERIKAYHARQMPADDRYVDAAGVELGHRWTALAAVGVYVPGGKAAYPSSVLMNIIPAKVAGVKRIAMVVPAPKGVLNPLVLAAAHLAGADEIYRVGGAQAVAALAYGTGTIKPVDKIVGPGNAYVAAAKRHVFGAVGIDMMAGPSEILVVADRDNDPAWIAADLLSQAEHDETAQAILITDDPDFARAVAEAVQTHLETMARAQIARASWESHGAIVTIPRIADAPPLVDLVAPEHLELAVADPEALLARVHHAGAVFLGSHTPEAVGDYVGGSNHVLPTSRSARFSSGLSVLDFMKRTSILRCTPDSLASIGPAAVTLAGSEGLEGHARSVSIRLRNRG